MKAFHGFLAVLAISFLSVSTLHAQQSVSIGTTTIDPNAVLVLVGDGKQGLVVPKTGDLNGMPKKAGMVVYNESDGKVYSCDGNAWTSLGGGVQGTTPVLQINGNQVSIFSGQNVNLAATAATQVGQLFMWDGTKWTSTSAPANSLAAGQVLTWSGTSWQPQTLPVGGTVTNVTGTAPINVTTGTTTPVISLANSGVTAGNYGNTNVIPQLAIDAQGRVTGATNISIQNANATTTGLLSSTDWTAFNSKGNGTVTNVTGTAPITVATGTTTPAISLANSGVTAGSYGSNSSVPVLAIDAFGRITSATNANIPTATASTNGLLNSTDWNTFNSKLGNGTTAGGDLTGTYPLPTIATGAVTSAKIADGSIAAADLSSMGAANAGQVLQWNGTAWTAATLSGTTFGNLTSSTTGINIVGGTGAVAGSGVTVNIQNATGAQPGLLTAADYTTFSNKQNAISLTTTGTSGPATLTGSTLNIPQYAASYLAGTGLTLTSNTFSVNTSQNISTLSNLTSNGLVKTSGGTGALSIAAPGTDYLVTETDATVKAISGIVKSNGTTISAAVAGTDYQAPLVSGTNIKTINGASVLGAGNITAVSAETDPTVAAINGLVKSNGTTISAAVAGTDYLISNQNITLSGDVSGSGTAAITTTIGTGAGNNIVTAINNAGTTGTINDNRLATISTAGKVSAAAITTGTFGTGAFGTQNISTTGTVNAGNTTVTGLTIGTSTWPASANGVLTNTGGVLSWAPAGTGDLLSTNNLSDVTNAATARTNLGLGTIATASTITTAEITDGTIALADLSSAAGILYNGSIPNSVGDLVGDFASGLTIQNQGTTGTNIITAINNGTATGTIPITRGGTGATTAAGALTSLGAMGNTLNSAQIFVGSAGNIATGVTLSGDATISNVGAVTLANSAATRTNLGLGALAILGSVSTIEITDGTITDLDINASGITTAGKVSGGAITSGTIGGSTALNTTGNITTTGTLNTGSATVSSLTIGATTINWPSNSPGTLTNNGTGTLSWAPAFTTNNTIPKGNGTALTASQIFDDGTNVGIGTSTPAYKLDVAGTTQIVNSTNGLRALEITNTVGDAVNITASSASNNTKALVANASSTGNWATGVLATAFGGAGQIALGVQSTANGVGTDNFGIQANATGAATNNFAVYGNAINGTNNWAGYFNNGNVFIKGALSVGADTPAAQGTAGQVLTSSGPGVAPIWSSVGGSSGWGLTGNTGTTPASQFIGTTDAVDFRLRTNNLERLAVTSTGNVGVGTTAPSAKLEVVSATSPALLLNGGGPSNNASLWIGRNGTNDVELGIAAVAGSFNTQSLVGDVVLRNGNGSKLIFTNSAVTTALVIGNSQYVGIGSLNPTERLDVSGPVLLQQTTAPSTTTDRLYNVSGSLFWNGTNISAGSSFNTLNFIPKGNGSAMVASNISDNGTQVLINSPLTVLSGANNAAFDANGSLTFSGTARMKIQAGAPAFEYAGNNAINLTLNNPRYDFGGLDGTLTPYVPFSIDWTASEARVSSTNSTATFRVVSEGQGATATDGLEIDLNASGEAHIRNNESGMMILGTGNNDVVHITSGGLVGLNTNSPAASLDMSGAIRLAPGSAPAPTTDRLYNSGGNLYWNGTNISAAGGWGLTGTGGTVDGTNYIGTSDNVPLNFGVNGQKAGRIESNSGTANTFFGFQSGSINTGLNNTGFGYQALTLTTTGYSNTAIGSNALVSNTTGFVNTATGTDALRFNNTGAANAAFGANALRANTIGGNNTAIGSLALYTNSTGGENVAVGTQSMMNNTTGTQNTASGFYALLSNTVGGSNTVSGGYTLFSNIAGSNATAIGYGAMERANDTATPFTNTNVAVGYQSLRGSASASANTGLDNTGLGYQSLQSFTSGGGNTALGNTTMWLNTTGNNNTAVGSQALLLNTSGNNNTAVGRASLQSSTGSQNVAIGADAMNGNIGGSFNTSIGYQALSVNSTGSNNTAIGRNADVGSNNLFNATAIGANAIVNASNKVRIGDASVTVIEGQVAYTNASDRRFKTDIQEISLGLDFIKKLRPVTYQMKAGDGRQNWGFIAQDIESLVGTDKAVLTIGQDSLRSLGLRYTDFIAPMVKAMQEQQKMIEEQRAEIEKLKAELKITTTQKSESKTTLEAKLNALTVEFEKLKALIGAEAKKD